MKKLVALLLDMRTLNLSYLLTMHNTTHIVGIAATAGLFWAMETISRADTREGVGITLPDAIAIALENNIGAKVERLQVDAAEERIIARKAEFDPSFNSSYLYESRDTPQNTRDFVATRTVETNVSDRIFSEENQRFSSTLGGKTAWGTTYEFGLELNSLKNTLNIATPPSLFYPEYESFFGLRITQPLLKNAGRNVQLAGLRVAAAERDIADLNWQLKTQQLVAQVAKNYYDFAFTAQDSEIKSRNLEMARQLETENTRRMDEGVGSSLDIQQSASAAAVREEELASSRLLYHERMNLLKRDLLGEADRTGAIRYTPREFPASNLSIPDRASLEADALRSRPEYLQTLAQIEKQKLVVAVARNQRLPQVDLVGSVGGRGLDGSAGSAVGESLEFSHPEWTVGVQMSIPLGGRAARSAWEEANIQLEQLLLNKQQIEIDLSLQIDTALERVNTSRERIALTESAVEAMRLTMGSEERRMEEGVGVSQNVLDAQRDLSAAETRRLAAVADLNKAVVDLWLVAGVIFEKYNISLSAAAHR